MPKTNDEYANRRTIWRAKSSNPHTRCDFGDASVDDAIGRGIEVFGKEIGEERHDYRADLR